MRTKPWLPVAFAMTAVGWGANQFAPMVQVYRDTVQVSAVLSTALFGLYAAGLVPTLLVAGWWSAHRGKRGLVRVGVSLSTVSSALLAVSAEHPGALLVGRILAGVAIGALMAPATAWVKELSAADSSPGVGARRATIALSSGFGGGALAAALIAHLPWTTVLPYVAHLIVVLAAAAWVWRTPELDTSDHATPRLGEMAALLRSRWFAFQLPLTAPWVFGAGTTSFVALPTAAAHRDTVLMIGLAALTTLGTGVALQPTIRRFEDRHRGVTLPAGMVAVALGLGLAMVAVDHAWALPLAWVSLGSAYGMTLVGGLRTIETHTPPRLLAPVSAVFYALTYVGFVAPWAIARLSGQLSFTAVLSVGVAMALVAGVVAVVGARGTHHPAG